MSDPMWRRPSRCDSGTCPEIKIYPNVVYVRNSQRPEVVLPFTPEEWGPLVAAFKAGEYDLPEVTA